MNGWPLQLLTVACLSLAAKMEEPLVPSLLDLQVNLIFLFSNEFKIKIVLFRIINQIRWYSYLNQVEGARFVFEAKNIQRMELLVLRVLEWRLRSISPFCYVSLFAVKIDPSLTYTGFLTSRAKDIILSIIQGN